MATEKASNICDLTDEELNIIIEDGKKKIKDIMLSNKEMNTLFQLNFPSRATEKPSNDEIRPAEKVGGITKIKNKNNKSYHFSKRLSKKSIYLRRKNNKTKKSIYRGKTKTRKNKKYYFNLSN